MNNSNRHSGTIINSSVTVNGNRYAGLCLYSHEGKAVEVELDDQAMKAYVTDTKNEYLGQAVLVQRGVAA